MSGPVKPYLGVTPTIAEDVFIADTAAVIGDVHIGAGSSVWYNTVIRGDAGSYIRIGERVNTDPRLHVAVALLHRHAFGGARRGRGGNRRHGRRRRGGLTGQSGQGW
jgi:UDP-3-O-[3-hydroxymyristoyl] glucosamine N-acyltransferase